MSELCMFPLWTCHDMPRLCSFSLAASNMDQMFTYIPIRWHGSYLQIPESIVMMFQPQLPADSRVYSHDVSASAK